MKGKKDVSESAFYDQENSEFSRCPTCQTGVYIGSRSQRPPWPLGRVAGISTAKHAIVPNKRFLRREGRRVLRRQAAGWLHPHETEMDTGQEGWRGGA